MKKTIALLTLNVLLLSSCSLTRTNTTKTTDIYGAGVIQNPVIVDLDVKELRVTGTATVATGKSLETVKSLAVTDALQNAKADVLVEPKFETETTGGKTKATVTGWPATYKNFRSIKAEDVPLLQVGVTQKAAVFQPTTTKKRRWWCCYN